jgi:hypothetical protein
LIVTKKIGSIVKTTNDEHAVPRDRYSQHERKHHE